MNEEVQAVLKSASSVLAAAEAVAGCYRTLPVSLFVSMPAALCDSLMDLQIAVRAHDCAVLALSAACRMEEDV